MWVTDGNCASCHLSLTFRSLEISKGMNSEKKRKAKNLKILKNGLFSYTVKQCKSSWIISGVAKSLMANKKITESAV